VANAIFDGTDAVMLSGETASGRHPVEATRMMARIAEQADHERQETDVRRRRGRALDIAETVCESVVHAAQMLPVRAIVAFTRSGSTARLISKYRPQRPVFAFCHDERIACRAALYWGVVPLVLPLELGAEAMLAAAEAELLRRRSIARGDILAVVAGSPGRPGQTNQMKLIRVGAR
jgi:pyruvate kinase